MKTATIVVAAVALVAVGVSVGVVTLGGDGSKEGATVCDDLLCVTRLEDRCTSSTTALMTVVLYAADPNASAVQYRIVVKDKTGTVVKDGVKTGSFSKKEILPSDTDVIAPNTASATYSSSKGELATFRIDPKEACASTRAKAL